MLASFRFHHEARHSKHSTVVRDVVVVDETQDSVESVDVADVDVVDAVVDAVALLVVDVVALLVVDEAIQLVVVAVAVVVVVAAAAVVRPHEQSCAKTSLAPVCHWTTPIPMLQHERDE